MAYIQKLLRKKGTVYKVEVIFSDYSKRSKTFRTREEANHWGRTQEDLKFNERAGGNTSVRITFDEFFEKFIEDYAKVHHSAGWLMTDRLMNEKYLRPTLGPRQLRDIHPVDVQRVMREMLKQGRAKSYANRVRALLHKVFTEAVKTYRYLAINPVSSVRPFKEDPFEAPHLKSQDAMKLLRWADTHPYGIAFHLAIQLGLREGEVLGLQWDAVDLENRSITIRRKWNKKTAIMDEFTKGRSIRYLGIYPDGLLERLREQKASHPSATFVACRPDGTRLCPMQLTRALQKGIKEADTDRVTFHGLRHTFATLYMQNGGDLYDLQLLMGHQSARTTERYRHRDPEYMKSKCNVFDLYSAETPPKREFTELKLVSSQDAQIAQ